MYHDDRRFDNRGFRENRDRPNRHEHDANIVNDYETKQLILRRESTKFYNTKYTFEFALDLKINGVWYYIGSSHSKDELIQYVNNYWHVFSSSGLEARIAQPWSGQQVWYGRFPQRHDNDQRFHEQRNQR